MSKGKKIVRAMIAFCGLVLLISGSVKYSNAKKFESKNDYFTYNIFLSTEKVEAYVINLTGNPIVIDDNKKIYRIFQILSEMQLTKMKEEIKEEQKVYGSCSMKIVTKKEQIFVVFQGDMIEINGIFYKCSSQRNDWMNELYDCFQ